MAQKSVVNYTRTPAAEDGEFRLSDGQLALGDADLVPPAPTVQMSEPVPAAGIGFVTLPAGWPRDVDEPHVAPAWNYWFVLSGEMELTASDGETRRFSKGGVVVAEDTTGIGHRTTVVNEAPVELAVVEKAD